MRGQLQNQATDRDKRSTLSPLDDFFFLWVVVPLFYFVTSLVQCTWDEQPRRADSVWGASGSCFFFAAVRGLSVFG